MQKTKRFACTSSTMLLVAVAVLGLFSSRAQAATYTVTSLIDAVGVCTGTSPNFSCTSLRTAISASNATTTVDDTIQFSVSGTIALASGLPSITDTVTINGTGITLNGAALSSGGNVLYLSGVNAGNSQISNISITNLVSSAIRISDASNVTISNNSLSNIASNGIQVQGSAGVSGVGTSNSVFTGNTITNITAGDGIAFQPSGNLSLQYNNNLIQNNTINGCTGQGISFDGGNNLIITNNTITGNTITRCNGDGIELTGLNANNNAVYANSIFANGGIGIDLRPTDGVTVNDAGDVDTGSNGLQNFPVVTSIAGNTVNFVLDTVANANGFRIDFYNNPGGLDPTGYGEGEAWLGSCQVATPSATIPSSCTITGVNATTLRMTATRCQNAGCVSTASTSIGSTSEFSGPVTTNLAITKTDGQTLYTPNQVLTYTIVVTNNGTSSVTNAIFQDPAVAGLNVTAVTCGTPTLSSQCPTAANTTRALMQGTGILVPLLTPGGSVTFTVTATATATSGNLTNIVTIGVPVGVTESAPANNTASDTDQIAGTIVIVKDAVPDNAQDFAFTTTGTGLSNFSLDDDTDPTLPNSRTFAGLAPGSYTVAETAVAQWTLSNLVCVDPDNGSTVSVGTGVATIDLDGGETVTCTFTNQKIAALTLRKQWSGAVTGDDATVTVSRGATVLRTLLSDAGNANELDTDSTPVTVNVGDVLTLQETLAGTNTGAYTNGLACTGTSGLSGSTLTVGVADTAIVCTYTNTRQQVDLSISKTNNATQLISGQVTSYTLTITNRGPIAVTGAVVRDPAVSRTGLNCPAGNTVTCSSATPGACPSATTTMGSLDSPGYTLGTLPVNAQATLVFSCTVP